MKINKKFSYLIHFTFVFITAGAQQFNLPFVSTEKALADSAISLPPLNTFKPVLSSKFVDSSALAVLHPLKNFSGGLITGGISPLLNLTYGTKNYNTLEGGAQAEASVGRQLSFYGDFQYGSSYLQPYMQNFVNQYGVMPGWGRVLKNDGLGHVEYDAYNFYASYSPDSIINLQMGRGKNFIGDGYRSLLLSDNTSAYPYFKIQVHFSRLNYTLLFAEMENLPVINGIVQPRAKFGAFHFLDIAVTKKLSIGLFEAVISEQEDSSKFYRGIDVSYLNPVIFYRPVEYSRDSPDNCLMGLNLHYKYNSKSLLYGQFILDDFDVEETLKGSGYFEDKYGIQLGIKWYDLLKIPGLYSQLEFNTVRPYTYAHKAPLQNYSDMNQALADPIGANFREFIYIGEFQKQNWLFSCRLTGAEYGDDAPGQHNGKNIFISDYASDLYGFGNYITQGVKTWLLNSTVQVNYRVSTTNNFYAFCGWNSRWLSSDIQHDKENYIFVGIRTHIYNYYNDF